VDAGIILKKQVGEKLILFIFNLSLYGLFYSKKGAMIFIPKTVRVIGDTGPLDVNFDLIDDGVRVLI